MVGLEASDWMVVVTSMVLVFLMLIVLCLLITLQGKIFDSLNGKGPSKPNATSKAPKAREAQANSGAGPRSTTLPVAARPAQKDTIPPEIIAVIAAAVHETLGEGAVIRGIRRIDTPAAGRRRSKWSEAGVYEATTPFM